MIDLVMICIFMSLFPCRWNGVGCWVSSWLLGDCKMQKDKVTLVRLHDPRSTILPVRRLSDVQYAEESCTLDARYFIMVCNRTIDYRRRTWHVSKFVF